MLLQCFVSLVAGWSGPSPALDAPLVLQRVVRGETVMATAVGSPGISGQVLLLGVGIDPPGGTDQVLATTVQDPGHPEEPWVITTYRRPDESYPAFIKRHRDTVEAVRETLQRDT